MKNMQPFWQKNLRSKISLYEDLLILSIGSAFLSLFVSLSTFDLEQATKLFIGISWRYL
jgi:hypothetical protein